MKKFYCYEKVEVSPEEYIKQRESWLKQLDEDVQAEYKRHGKKLDKLEVSRKKLIKDILEAKQTLPPKVSAQEELDNKIKEASINNKIKCPTIEGAQLPTLGFR